MSTGRISLEQRGAVLLIGIDRVAKRNAFDLDMFIDLSRAYAQLENAPELRCGVLHAHGEHFTGGLELPKWTPLFARGEGTPQVPDGLDPLALNPARRLTKPMVCAVQGWCLTLGIELMLAADIRVAAGDTRFAQIEVKRGIYPIGGATFRFVQELGWGNAMRYLLTGDEFSAADAYRMGIIQQVVEPGTQLAHAIGIAQTIARQAPLAVRETIRSARIWREQGEAACVAELVPCLQRMLASEDAKEGLAAFSERREARFIGR